MKCLKFGIVLFACFAMMVGADLMLHWSSWKIIAVCAVAVFIIIYSAYSFFPPR